MMTLKDRLTDVTFNLTLTAYNLQLSNSERRNKACLVLSDVKLTLKSSINFG